VSLHELMNRLAEDLPLWCLFDAFDKDGSHFLDRWAAPLAPPGGGACRVRSA
jgi:hypothetical protein